ncbi:GNAT family N-acetyltransferase [Streptococcus sciuri]|uniref:GNAT family N-acetyltransferase n=1 Tax=Streptococcus sciuri TaxID=2973939 RepID=A0ABT2F9F4_9STRE|nr:GNAT family N-acetyltransferase [Streptococcus sciuri]MCS4488848.1 GNAT family N-acetyltransferase [Streptococcus sciuri]
MMIRNVRLEDFEIICQIEQSNFSIFEAASPQAMRERIELLDDTFLVAEVEGNVVGYIVATAVLDKYLNDDIFKKVIKNPIQGSFIAVMSLSVSKSYKKQGFGTALLAALKDVAISRQAMGITLTCHEELITYYEMNGFCNEGESLSSHGQSTWYNMLWYC